MKRQKGQHSIIYLSLFLESGAFSHLFLWFFMTETWETTEKLVLDAIDCKT